MKIFLFFILISFHSLAGPSPELNRYMVELSQNFSIKIEISEPYPGEDLSYCLTEENKVLINPKIQNHQLSDDIRNKLSAQVAICWLKSQK